MIVCLCNSNRALLESWPRRTKGIMSLSDINNDRQHELAAKLKIVEH